VCAASSIRVAIVDDNHQFGEALGVLLGLEPRLVVVGTLEDGELALEFARSESVDVYLVDFRLPDMNGAEATRAILEASPSSKVVALSAAAAAPEVKSLLGAGAVACLSKDRDLDTLVATITEAAASPVHTES
jgi:DNA-binding NarL/FixJ family response regulator